MLTVPSQQLPQSKHPSHTQKIRPSVCATSRGRLVKQPHDVLDAPASPKQDSSVAALYSVLLRSVPLVAQFVTHFSHLRVPWQWRHLQLERYCNKQDTLTISVKPTKIWTFSSKLQGTRFKIYMSSIKKQTSSLVKIVSLKFFFVLFLQVLLWHCSRRSSVPSLKSILDSHNDKTARLTCWS